MRRKTKIIFFFTFLLFLKLKEKKICKKIFELPQQLIITFQLLFIVDNNQHQQRCVFFLT